MKSFSELLVSFLSIQNINSDGLRGGGVMDYEIPGEECGTHSHSKEEKDHAAKVVKNYRERLSAKKMENNTKAAMMESFEFDVYFHIIMNSEGEGGLSDKMAEFSIELLNEAFSGNLKHKGQDCDDNDVSGLNTNISFKLRNITRTISNEWYNMKRDDTAAAILQSRELRLGSCSALNIYTMSSDEFGGWATGPIMCNPYEDDNIDGIWVDLKSLPKSCKSSRPNTLVHEVGHWAGLDHVFEGECTDYFGDGVKDTPRQKKVSRECPAVSDTCEGGGIDSIHNYMAYTSLCCRYTFTQGQVERMHALLDRWRTDPYQSPSNYDDFYPYFDDTLDDDYFL